MKHRFTLAGLCVVFAVVGCASNAEKDGIAHDHTTPEGAILCLEDAYRAKDIEAAVRCKDFRVEAELMLQNLQTDFSGDEEILAKATEVLELGYRKELKETGIPDFRGLTSTFSNKKPYKNRDDVVRITEHCRDASGNTTTNQLAVAKTADGWKVVSVTD